MRWFGNGKQCCEKVAIFLPLPHTIVKGFACCVFVFCINQNPIEFHNTFARKLPSFIAGGKAAGAEAAAAASS